MPSWRLEWGWYERLGLDDFGEAAAALQAAQYVLSDSHCTSPGQCQIFQGQAAGCKQAVGGIVDCCKTPAGVSLIETRGLELLGKAAGQISITQNSSDSQ
ncbi:conjugal transfer protein TraN [Lamprobacter modestohalophilus]|uniref:conjugal transfer protein TraN n=1 Tax=Lamprobacter modestohalophilus TaxID=1064514 RepID=UPI002ADEE78E|nr:conjugal transfer protein TraN [Lamprobacter modestohalophilus]MEA1052181.1 conjugal transfer protein TraN [Lamprobacter modestohalophilus]